MQSDGNSICRCCTIIKPRVPSFVSMWMTSGFLLVETYASGSTVFQGTTVSEIDDGQCSGFLQTVLVIKEGELSACM